MTFREGERQPTFGFNKIGTPFTKAKVAVHIDHGAPMTSFVIIALETVKFNILVRLYGSTFQKASPLSIHFGGHDGNGANQFRVIPKNTNDAE